MQMNMTLPKAADSYWTDLHVNNKLGERCMNMWLTNSRDNTVAEGKVLGSNIDTFRKVPLFFPDEVDLHAKC